MVVHDSAYFKELLISNKANGYRDLLAKIDLSTYRRLPWERNIPFFLCSFIDPDTSSPLAADPRSLLSGVIDQAEGMGYRAMAGAEFEVSSVSR